MVVKIDKEACEVLTADPPALKKRMVLKFLKIECSDSKKKKKRKNKQGCMYATDACGRGYLIH